MPGRYHIAVSTAGDRAIAGPVVASALVLDAAMPSPRFTWPGMRGGQYISLSDFDAVPWDIQRQILSWLRKNSAGYSCVIGTVQEINRATLDASRGALLGRAVYRAVECAMVRDEKFHLSPRDTRIWVAGDVPVPQRYIGSAMQRLFLGRHGQPWYLEAAYACARLQRDSIMRALSERHPEYNFTLNQGYATMDHRRAVQLQGPSPQHRTHTSTEPR